MKDWSKLGLRVYLCAALLGALGHHRLSHAEPEAGLYQLDISAVPTSAASAASTFDSRADAVYHYEACGREGYFARRFAAGEVKNELQTVLAKLIVYANWTKYARTVRQDVLVCDFTYRYQQRAGDAPPDPTRASKAIQDAWGTVCSGVVVDSGIDADGYSTERYNITKDCVRSQINKALKQIKVAGTVGSTGLPCWPPDKQQDGDRYLLTEGEWHINVKDLTRIYYYNERTGRVALDEPIRTKVRDELLTLDGRPGPDNYNIGQCGAQDHSTGSPDERAEAQDWLDKTLDDIGDSFDWMRKWLERLGLVAIAAGAAYLALGPLGAALAAGIAGLGVVVVTIGSIPETENHRLMIESSRYLNNQIILAEMSPGSEHRSAMESSQQQVREWLLKRLQRIVKEEFEEYNARPYQRYSLHAIRALFDFANNRDVVLAARNVLDLATAKAALGSNQGRRLVPFRRLMEVVHNKIEYRTDTNPDGTRPFNGLMDHTGNADHQVASLLLYAGQAQQAPNGRLSYGAASEMVVIASSFYRPPIEVLELAIDKSIPYQQRLKHHGVEVYSSESGFLLTAGGIRVEAANTIKVAGASLGANILGVIPLSFTKDQGAAVPTTLMLTADRNRTSLEAFLHIAGHREALDDKNATYDHNLCVWRGFACGYNVRAPQGMLFVSGPGGWSFFDSKGAPAYQDGPQVMIARYTEGCTGDSTDCDDNVGFFEAVSDPGVSFAAFQQTVLANNPRPQDWRKAVAGVLSGNRILLSGTYRSFRGDLIEFDTAGHQLDSNRTGILAVNGVAQAALGDWQRAEGDVITGTRDGKFDVRAPRTRTGFRIDMSDWNAPSWAPLP